MRIGKFEIVKNKACRFSWKPHRLTLKSNPPIYHWFWCAFGFDQKMFDYVAARTKSGQYVEIRFKISDIKRRDGGFVVISRASISKFFTDSDPVNVKKYRYIGFMIDFNIKRHRYRVFLTISSAYFLFIYTSSNSRRHRRWSKELKYLFYVGHSV